MRISLLALTLSACAGLTAHSVDVSETDTDGLGTVPTLPGDDDDAVGDDDDDDITLVPQDELCNNDADDDGDGDTDCDDADCLSVCDADGDGAIALSRGGDDCDDGNGAVYPGATETCDGVDSDCDGQDCLDWTVDFEGAPDPVWVASGAAPWNLHLASPDVYEGAYAAQSGPINHSQASRASVDVTFPAGGTIAFWYRVSSESGFDYLRFRVDGLLVGEWSGSVPWTHASYAAPAAGTFTLEWAYEKDGSVNSGADVALIDLLEITGGGP